MSSVPFALNRATIPSATFEDPLGTATVPPTRIWPPEVSVTVLKSVLVVPAGTGTVAMPSAPKVESGWPAAVSLITPTVGVLAGGISPAAKIEPSEAIVTAVSPESV